jgi:hypothetical protein
VADSLRVPLIKNQPYEVRREVRAALLSEIAWICGTNQIDQIYAAWPDFTGRSIALHKLIVDRLAAKFPNQHPELACHCHDNTVSLVFQVNKLKHVPEPAADEEFSMYARRNLETIERAKPTSTLHLANAVSKTPAPKNQTLSAGTGASGKAEGERNSSGKRIEPQRPVAKPAPGKPLPPRAKPRT